MSKKHYIKIASLLAAFKRVAETEKSGDARMRGISDGAAWAAEVLAHNLADVFAADNPKFDADKFMAACGVEGER